MTWGYRLLRKDEEEERELKGKKRRTDGYGLGLAVEAYIVSRNAPQLGGAARSQIDRWGGSQRSQELYSVLFHIGILNNLDRQVGLAEVTASTVSSRDIT